MRSQQSNKKLSKKPPVSGKCSTQTSLKIKGNFALDKQQQELIEKDLHNQELQSIFCSSSKSYRVPNFNLKSSDVSKKFFLKDNSSNRCLIKMSNTSLKGSEQQIKQQNFIQETAQLLNQKANFQKSVDVQSSSSNFLCQIGAKQTSQAEIDGSQLEEYIKKKPPMKRVQVPSINQMTQEETLKQYQNLDIERKLQPQVIKKKRMITSARTPNSVITYNTLNLKDQLDEAKDTVSQIALSQLKNPNKQKPQTAKQSRKSTHQIKCGNQITTHKPPIKRQIQSARVVQSNRLQSGRIQQMPEEELEIIEDESGSFDDNFEQIQNNVFRPISAFSEKFKHRRPISGATVATNQFFKEYKKYTSFNDDEIPYEQLFDRNERTIAATYCKYGDLGYYCPVQRIGSYYQFCSKLKLTHLLEVVNLQQTVSNQDKNEFEIPIQLAIIDDLKGQQKQKTGISSNFSEADISREPVTLSIYPEYFEETETMNTEQCAEQYLEKQLKEMGGVYDPQYLGKKNYVYINEEDYPEELKKELYTSMKRYMHYINSNIINSQEIPIYDRKWINNATKQLPYNYLEENQLKRLYEEIFQDFKIAMKKCMLNYVLLSPEQRQRLNITLLPKRILNSAERIAREGGFNLILHDRWHIAKLNALEFCQNSLVQMNSINQTLNNWFNDFNHFKLIELKTFEIIKVLGYSLNFSTFIKIQGIYRQSVISFFKNVWYRGVLMIIKKQKILKRKDLKNGK